MSELYYFTPEQKEIAGRTNLPSLLLAQGESLKPSGSEWEWTCRGQKVTIRDNLWYHQYEQVGGDAVSFVRKFMEMNYLDAIDYLLRFNGIAVPERTTQGSKAFELPPANENMNRVFAYLVKQRGIEKDILYAFVGKNMIYESAQHHNAVFVGYDHEGFPRHAHKHSTAKEGAYKCNVAGSRSEYSFHWVGSGEKLFLFEAPIDLLSFISLYRDDWRRYNYAASCSVSDKVLFQFLKDCPMIQTVYLCFDNDEPGQAAAKRISDKLFVRGIKSEILAPVRKDWNEDLLHHKEGSGCEESLS